MDQLSPKIGQHWLVERAFSTTAGGSFSDYLILEGDILRLEGDGSYSKLFPGLQVPELHPSPEQLALLRPLGEDELALILPLPNPDTL